MTNASRDAFEAAMRARGFCDAPFHWTLEDDGAGGYHKDATDWAWAGWQAASAQPVADPVAPAGYKLVST